MHFPLAVVNQTRWDRREPVWRSVPLPPGLNEDLTVIDGEGRPVLNDCRILARYEDGSPKVVGFWFLAEVGGNQRRIFAIKEGQEGIDSPLKVQERPDCIEVNTGEVTVSFDRKGNELLSLALIGEGNLLSGPSGTLSQNGWFAGNDPGYVVQVKSGNLVVEITAEGKLLGPQGEVFSPFFGKARLLEKVLLFAHSPKVWYRRCALQLLRAEVEPAWDRHYRGSIPLDVLDWYSLFRVENPGAIRTGAPKIAEMSDPQDVTILWKTFEAPWLEVSTPTGDLLLHFPGLENSQMGTVHLHQLQEELWVRLSHVNGLWWYASLFTGPDPLDIFRGFEGDTLATEFSLVPHRGQREKVLASLQEPLSVRVPTEHRRRARQIDLAPSTRGNLIRKFVEKTLTFVPKKGRYRGFLMHGYDRINDVLLEAYNNRIEIAGFLLKEFYRTGREELREMALLMGQTYIHRMIYRGEQEEAFGGGRYRMHCPVGDNFTSQRISAVAVPLSPVSTKRGIRECLMFYQETGEEEYLQVAVAQAEWLLRRIQPEGHVCDRFIRQTFAARELAELWRFTGEDRYRQTALGIARAVCSWQNPDGSWYAWYGTGDRPRERFCYWVDGTRMPEYNCGEWIQQAPKSPHLMGYTLLGLLDMLDILPNGLVEQAVERGCDWMVKVQEEGCWGYLSSKGARCGYHASYIALALAKAYQRFKKKSYWDAVKRTIGWLEGQMEEKSYVPAHDLFPYNRLETPLIYGYGIELLRVMDNIEDEG